MLTWVPCVAQCTELRIAHKFIRYILLLTECCSTVCRCTRIPLMRISQVSYTIIHFIILLSNKTFYSFSSFTGKAGVGSASIFNLFLAGGSTPSDGSSTVSCRRERRKKCSLKFHELIYKSPFIKFYFLPQRNSSCLRRDTGQQCQGPAGSWGLWLYAQPPRIHAHWILRWLVLPDIFWQVWPVSGIYKKKCSDTTLI